MRALVADDEPQICELLSEFLSRRGYEVTTALDGEEALSALRREKPDLFLLDLYMPELDGLGLLRKICDESLDAGTIWTMTGMGDDDAARASLRLGATDFFTKPVDLRHLDWRLRLERAHENFV
ncbi:MAG: response regulator [Acidobacteriota bacterium]